MRLANVLQSEVGGRGVLDLLVLVLGTEEAGEEVLANAVAGGKNRWRGNRESGCIYKYIYI